MTLSERSEDSVWNRRMPPMRSIGRIATAIAMKPMPPSQCSSERQMSMPGDILSSPESTVEPVAVMPDMLSKIASVKLMCRANMNGREEKKQTITQLDTVSMYMSRGRRCTCSGRPGMTRPSPQVKVMIADQMKGCSSLARP